MNFIYVIHLMCRNYLVDLITHNRNRNNRSNSRGGDNNKGRALRARPLLLPSLPLLFLLLLLCVIRWLQYNMWMT